MRTLAFLALVALELPAAAMEIELPPPSGHTGSRSSPHDFAKSNRYQFRIGTADGSTSTLSDPARAKTSPAVKLHLPLGSAKTKIRLPGNQRGNGYAPGRTIKIKR